MNVGDRVLVDLSGMYLAMCERCETRTLMVPGGACHACSAREEDVTWLCDLGPEDAVPIQ